MSAAVSPQRDLPPIDVYQDDPPIVRATSAEPGPLTSPRAPPAQLVQVEQLSESLLLAPVEPETYLLPGLVPTEAYSLLAGALSSYKSTLLVYLSLWRATGYDLLNLDPTEAGCDIGPVMLMVYEDSSRRFWNRIRRIVQHSQAELRRGFGERDGTLFVERAAKNLRVVPMTGKVGATLVCRGPNGLVLPNEELIQQIEVEAKKLTKKGLLIAIDPLRLAIVGSQSDDDGADIVVHTLNRIAMLLPNSGVIVASHTSKSGAREQADDYTGASYATSGSALYSQHARSNFLMARIRPSEVQKVLDIDLSAEELDAQPIARLTHGRLSHGPESSDSYLHMQSGVLVPVRPRRAVDTQDHIARTGPVIVAAMQRLKLQEIRISATSLLTDAEVARLGTEKQVRAWVKLLEDGGYIEFIGSTKNRAGQITAKGLERFATNQNESREP